jgi:hypothetical protein
MCGGNGSKRGHVKRKEEWTRLNRAIKCVIKFEKRRIWKNVFVGLTGRLQRKYETFKCSSEE